MENTDQAEWEASKEYAQKAKQVASDLRKYSLVRYLAMTVLVVTLPAAVILVQRQTKGPETLASAGDVQVYFVPNYTEVPPGRVVKLVLDSNTKNISRVRVGVIFDKSLMKLDGEVLTTPLLKEVLVKSSVEEANLIGKMTLELGLAAMDRNNPPEGVVELASLLFEPVTDRQGVVTNLEVDPKEIEIKDVLGHQLTVSTQPAEMVLNLAKDEDAVLGTSTEPATVSGYIPTRIPADLDGDGCVGWGDFKILADLLGKPVVNGMLGDINGDGKVTVADIGLWATNYGWGCK